MDNAKSLKQKEQLDGYKKASIIKGILFDYERILQDLTLEQLEEGEFKFQVQDYTIR